MPYIIKSSLDIGGKILPWNEQEANKLIKEKEEFINKKEEETEQVNEQDAKMEENTFKKKQDSDMPFRRNKKRDKVGEN